MRGLLAVLAVIAAACGDNEILPDGGPIAPAERVVLVAHTDDDLIFLQPDLDDAIARGESVTIAFSMQGLATEPQSHIDDRVRGSETAYGEVAGSQAWSCGWTDLGTLPVWHCRLADRPLAIVYLGYPDGGKYGDHDDSLLHLWQGTIASTWTIGAKARRVDKDAMIEAVAELFRVTMPRVIMTEDYSSLHGRDHSDHMLTAALAITGAARAHTESSIVAYRGYNSDGEAVNKADVEIAREQELLGFYWACYDHCGACGTDACPIEDVQHRIWLHRQYASSRRRLPMAGVLAHGDRCAVVAGDTIAMGSCDAAPAWRFEADGTLRAPDGRCATASNGAALVAVCTGAPEQFVVFDDEGHLWSGAPPEVALPYDHLSCLTEHGFELCGQGLEVQWDLASPIVHTDLASLGFHAGAFQLATIDHQAALCAATAAGIRCAPSHGDGTFGASAVVSPLVVDAESLRFGDLDHDGTIDACGLADDAVRCAVDHLAHVETWLPQAAGLDPTTLALIGGGLCARIGTSVRCYPNTGSGFAAPSPLAVTPDSALWITDLDGDSAPDVCVGDEAGPRCGRGSEPLQSWGYSRGGIVEGSSTADNGPMTVSRAALGDVDGDGLPDLCRITPTGVRCATNQGHAFGPSHLATVRGDTLLVGDLDGDGRADTCVVTGTELSCSLAP